MKTCNCPPVETMVRPSNVIRCHICKGPFDLGPETERSRAIEAQAREDATRLVEALKHEYSVI